jgi:hypothetical protein
MGWLQRLFGTELVKQVVPPAPPKPPPGCSHEWVTIPSRNRYVRTCPKCGAMQFTSVPFEKLEKK